jgi:hypothetical protein
LPPQDDRRRLSSRAVKIGMVSALSMTMVACGSDRETRAYCVDDEAPPSLGGGVSGYKVVDDYNCDDDDLEDGTTSYGRYFWYYGGRQDGTGYVSGGSRISPSEGKVVTAGGKTVSRGGFGGSGSGGS